MKLYEFPTDYTVLDVETTGTSPEYCEIIELAAIRVRNGEVVDKFVSFVKPDENIPEFITDLTGITNDMVNDAPKIYEVIGKFKDFIGNDIIVGHNVTFDIRFLSEQADFVNDYFDTLSSSRKLLPEMPHHRLKDLIAYFNIPTDKLHRSFEDCLATYNALCCLCDLQKETGISLLPKKLFGNKKSFDLRTLASDGSMVDEDNYFYGRRCCFTGVLEKYTRKEAAQMVVNVGGFCDNGVTTKTNYLILGNNDYCSSIKDGKSNKQKKAEELILKGCDMQIIDENTFYSLILDTSMNEDLIPA